MTDYLAPVADEIAKCMRCGNCQAVCPLYDATHLEPAVARGKIRLADAVLKGEITPTKALAERFDMCLTCLACVSNCPCGVRVDRIILAARAATAQQRSLLGPARMACAVLPRQRLLARGAWILSRAQGLAFKRWARGMSPRFPLGLETRRILPPLAPTSFMAKAPETNPVPGDKPIRVALFAGCLANYLYPATAQAAVEVLNAAGVTVLVPKEQHCCGYPVISAGGVALAREMARSHVRMFAALDVEAVITLCGTCGEAFLVYYPQLLAGDPELGPAAAFLAERTHDITRYLVTIRQFNPAALGRLNLAVTYHEPCHLGRGLGVTDEPVALLKSIPGVSFKPLKEPARCCGGAGTFAFSHYQLASDVRRPKIADIQATETEVVATGCSACRMHLEEGLAQEGAPQRAVHTVEILARALRPVKGGRG